MSYSKKKWKNATVEYPNRRSLYNVDTGETTVVKISKAPGNISVVGDEFNADTMNDLETRIDNGFTEIETEISTIESSVSADVQKAEAAAQTASSKVTEINTLIDNATGNFDELLAKADTDANTAVSAANLATDSINTVTEIKSEVNDIYEDSVEVYNQTIAINTKANQNRLDSEAYAVGTRDGVEVTDEDVAYHNNAKYYASYYDTKMDKYNPTGSGAFSLNRKDGTTVGQYSSAEGSWNEASGIASHAEGQSNVASGVASHTEGQSNVASNQDSHAEGQLTTASGTVSHTEGLSTIASGSYSHAENNSTIASGEDSHAEGYDSHASGEYSHAENNTTLASGNYSHAEGGYSIASGAGSHAEGYNNTPITIYSSVSATYYGGGQFGIDPSYTKIKNGQLIRISSKFYEIWGVSVSTTEIFFYVYGYSSFNYDDNATVKIDYILSSPGAKGSGSHTEGMDACAIGNFSHAEGEFSEANGEASHAEGRTSAFGRTSHSEGYDTQTLGFASHSEGLGTLAQGDYSHTEGKSSYQPLGEIKITSAVAGTKNAYITLTASSSSSYAKAGNYLKVSTYKYGNSGLIPILTDMDDNNQFTIAFYLNVIDIITKYNEYGDGTCTIYKFTHPNIASGEASHTEGWGTQANGAESHAEGFETIANGDMQHVEGKYNVIDVDNKYQSIVGGGTSEAARKNIYTLDWSGNAWFAGDVTIGDDSSTLAKEKEIVLSGDEWNNSSEKSVINIYRYKEETGTAYDKNAIYLMDNGNIIATDNDGNALIMGGSGDGEQSDWNETDTEAKSYIKNKPTIPSKTSDLENDSAFITIEDVPKSMIFKGTLGTSGTISELPSASSSNTGYTYKVITDGTYAEQDAKIGDVFISNGTEWTLVPSGDDPENIVKYQYNEATKNLTLFNIYKKE